jgi:hypothetical protein
MTTRGLIIGALSTIVFFGTLVPSDTASAASRKAKKIICVSFPPPVCPITLHPVCQKKNVCRGCVRWACLPPTPFPPPTPRPAR